ncbi:TPA: hypothetical protein DIS56_01620 [Candidatus Saccharibacteria bacterium]|nr:MAG: hypothetical protein A3F05_03660 [Candidatus Saccharibacteria bacterium RIFCSPHIGHO2_12_FULL_47_17]HCM51812.1 hypothetical protein [Candidatus Saccharibacteria bacterium]
METVTTKNPNLVSRVFDGLFYAPPQEAINFLQRVERGETDGLICWRSNHVKLSESKIDGEGLISVEDITRGQLVAIKHGQVLTEDEVRQYAHVIRGSQQQIGPDRFLAGKTEEEVKKSKVGYNHSCDANGIVIVLEGIDLAFVLARRDISRGEEVTTDYSVSFASDTAQIEDCNCGSDKCRHIIRPAEDWKDPEFQVQYRDEFPYFIQRQIDFGEGYQGPYPVDNIGDTEFAKAILFSTIARLYPSLGLSVSRGRFKEKTSKLVDSSGWSIWTDPAVYSHETHQRILEFMKKDLLYNGLYWVSPGYWDEKSSNYAEDLRQAGQFDRETLLRLKNTLKAWEVREVEMHPTVSEKRMPDPGLRAKEEAEMQKTKRRYQHLLKRTKYPAFTDEEVSELFAVRLAKYFGETKKSR